LIERSSFNCEMVAKQLDMFRAISELQPKTKVITLASHIEFWPSSKPNMPQTQFGENVHAGVAICFGFSSYWISNQSMSTPSPASIVMQPWSNYPITFGGQTKTTLFTKAIICLFLIIIWLFYKLIQILFNSPNWGFSVLMNYVQ